jgi:hypothetical protein
LEDRDQTRRYSDFLLSERILCGSCGRGRNSACLRLGVYSRRPALGERCHRSLARGLVAVPCALDVAVVTAPPDGPFRLWEEPVRELRPDNVRELRDEVRDMRDDVRERLRDEVRDMRRRDWRRRMASHVSSPWLSDELSPSPSLTILVTGFGWQRWVIGMVNGPSQIAEFRLANATIAAYLVLRRRGFLVRPSHSAIADWMACRSASGIPADPLASASGQPWRMRERCFGSASG